MRLKASILIGLLLTCSAFTICLAADYPLHKFSYQEGFEGEAPKVEEWAKNGESVVNYLGPSEEQAFEGKKSLKLDVTLKGGSFHYWGAAVRVPCAGKLKLSARVLVGEGTTAQVGFGMNFLYPPTQHSGCGPIESFTKPTGGWKLVEGDLVERGREGAAGVMTYNTATVEGKDVGATLDRWSLFILGGEGQRAIVYLDDVRIEGEVPSEEDFQADLKQRWAKGQERLQKSIETWREEVAASEQGLGKIGEVPEFLQDTIKSTKATAARAKGIIDHVAYKGYASRDEVGSLEQAIAAIRYAPETISAISKGKEAGQPYLIYTPRAITNDRFSTDVFPIPAHVGKELTCSGCRGEYEPLTAAIYALEDLKGFTVSVSDLKGPAGVIPKDAVDIRVVKCWYQAGREVWDTKHKVYVPELLLKDDNLVRVDMEKQENYLHSTAADGTETYLLCSGPTSENLKDVRPIDSPTLQPVDISARSLKQFWITVHVPDHAKAGVYQGKVTFHVGNGSQEMPLKVTVYSFDLAPSRLIYSIYYRATLSPDGKPTITSESKSEEQYRAEMADLKAHGVLYPANYQGMDEKVLRRTLEIRKEVGLPGGPFFNLGQGTGAATNPNELDTLKQSFKRWIEFCKPFGYDPVYFYGADEATGDQLIAQKAAWKAVQDAGGKTFVACYEKTFEAMGGLLNCAVLAGKPDPEQARKWHSVGSQAFCYAYPQVGNEEPETYRRHFGLMLWKAGFDGAMDYAYQHGFGHVWNDFDDPTYRDHVFAYPTVNGVVDTIEWEGFREAVEDVRYVTTLEQRIAKAPDSKKGIAKQARTWLDNLKPETADLYETRAKLVEWILRLTSNAKGR